MNPAAWPEVSCDELEDQSEDTASAMFDEEMRARRLEKRRVESLRRRTPKPVLWFQGKYRFLSNFWPAIVEFEGATYTSVEHGYQAAKTDDEELRRFIRAGSAGQAKRLTRGLEPRASFDRMAVMASLLRQKFSAPELREMLLATGNRELVEGNRWGDDFWGRATEAGRNELGRMLVKLRSDLKECSV